jgi:hypothetical protein
VGVLVRLALMPGVDVPMWLLGVRGMLVVRVAVAVTVMDMLVNVLEVVRMAMLVHVLMSVPIFAVIVLVIVLVAVHVLVFVAVWMAAFAHSRVPPGGVARVSRGILPGGGGAGTVAVVGVS